MYQSVTLGDKLPNVTLKVQGNQPFGTIYRTDRILLTKTQLPHLLVHPPRPAKHHPFEVTA